eukprot:2578854-Rhodomonas_salina.1
MVCRGFPARLYAHQCRPYPLSVPRIRYLRTTCHRPYPFSVLRGIDHTLSQYRAAPSKTVPRCVIRYVSTGDRVGGARTVPSPRGKEVWPGGQLSKHSP